jgi:hypothetical protein
LHQVPSHVFEGVLAGTDPPADITCSAEAVVVQEPELQLVVDDNGGDLEQSKSPGFGAHVGGAGRVKASNAVEINCAD